MDNENVLRLGDRVRVVATGSWKHNLAIGAVGRVIDVAPDGLIGLNVGGATAFVPRECLHLHRRG